MNPAGMMAVSTKGRAGGNLWNHKKPAVKKNLHFFKEFYLKKTPFLYLLYRG